MKFERASLNCKCGACRQHRVRYESSVPSGRDSQSAKIRRELDNFERLVAKFRRKA